MGSKHTCSADLDPVPPAPPPAPFKFHTQEERQNTIIIFRNEKTVQAQEVSKRCVRKMEGKLFSEASPVGIWQEAKGLSGEEGK